MRGETGQELQVVSALDVDDARAVEAAAHYLLASKRIKGEWFDVSPEEAVDAVRSAVELVESGEWATRNRSKPVAITMTEEEAALLDRVAQREGGRKAAVMAGLRAIDGGPHQTDLDLAEALYRRLKGRQSR